MAAVPERIGADEAAAYDETSAMWHALTALTTAATRANCAGPVQPSIAAASNRRGSTERTPNTVLTRIG